MNVSVKARAAFPKLQPSEPPARRGPGSACRAYLRNKPFLETGVMILLLALAFV